MQNQKNDTQSVDCMRNDAVLRTMMRLRKRSHERKFMKSDRLSEMSLYFSVEIIELVKRLKMQKEYIVSAQIGRSGTSIGANIHEAHYAQSAKDFVSKFEIALKEASETSYWLKVLYRTDYISEEEFHALDGKCTSLRAMLVHSCKTVKERNSL